MQEKILEWNNNIYFTDKKTRVFKSEVIGGEGYHIASQVSNRNFNPANLILLHRGTPQQVSSHV